MNQRFQLAIKLIISHLLFIIGLIFFSFISTSYSFLILSIAQSTILILYLAGYWEFFGLGFKKVFCLSMEIGILSVFIWKLSGHSSEEGNAVLIFLISLIQFYLLFLLIKIIRVIYEKEDNAIEIDFPFKEGGYLVTDGGNSKISRLMNYHYYSSIHKKKKTSNSMLYATDIVKIKNERSNFFPKENEQYPIFNEKLYSPMYGRVVKVINGIQDNKPYSGDYPYNTGNTVVICTDNLYLLLGHLRENSIQVKEGDLVKRNDLIAVVGNSGWTERPHLHMQLIKSDSLNYWSGQGINIQFKHRNLYKNRLIRLNGIQAD